MSVTFRVEQFEGPLDLLLQLVEKEELVISEISLTKVADQYLKHLNAHKGKIPAEELADFLVVAAKLVYMKSKLLIPSLADEELDEGPDLASQLRLYQRFMHAATLLEERWNSAQVCYARERKVVRSLEVSFVPPEEINASAMRVAMMQIIARLTPIVKLPQAAVKRLIRIQDKISELANRLRTHSKMKFSHFIRDAKDKHERLVSFLALLELVKQRIVHAEQGELFEDIDIAANDLDRLADLKIEFA